MQINAGEHFRRLYQTFQNKKNPIKLKKCVETQSPLTKQSSGSFILFSFSLCRPKLGLLYFPVSVHSSVSAVCHLTGQTPLSLMADFVNVFMHASAVPCFIFYIVSPIFLHLKTTDDQPSLYPPVYIAFEYPLCLSVQADHERESLLMSPPNPKKIALNRNLSTSSTLFSFGSLFFCKCLT